MLNSENYDDVWLYLPAFNQLMCVSEGSGDNLLQEDIDAGYVDYIYYSQYDLSDQSSEIDGGMILLTVLFREKYTNTAECIQEVIDMAYGIKDVVYHIGASAEELQILYGSL